MSDFTKNAAAKKKSDDTNEILKGACINLFVFIFSTFFVAWMVMFSAAILGFASLGYLACLLLTYTASGVIGLGTMTLKGSK